MRKKEDVSIFVVDKRYAAIPGRSKQIVDLILCDKDSSCGDIMNTKIGLWSIESGELETTIDLKLTRRKLEEDSDLNEKIMRRIRAIAFSPNGKYVALGHVGGSITLWETTTSGSDDRGATRYLGNYKSTIWNGVGVGSIGQLEFLPNSTIGK